MSAIEHFLGDLASRLHVGRRARARILREVGDHLDDAVARREEAGESREAAVRQALEAFGSPGLLATQFNAEAGSRAMRQAPAVVVLAGVLVLGGLLVATATQPTPPVERSADLATQISFFLALVSCEIAVVAGFCAASRTAARWRRPAVPAADRRFVRRCSTLSLSALAVSAAGWATVMLLSRSRWPQTNELALVAGGATMVLGVVVAIAVMTRLRMNPADDAPDASDALGVDDGVLGLGERAIEVVHRHSVLSCASVTTIAAVSAMLHAETTALDALPWGASQAAAVVLGFVLLGPALELRAVRRA